MEILLKQIRAARRRLTFQAFVKALPWALTIPLAIALALVAVDKFRPLQVAYWQFLAGGAGVGVIAAAAWALFTRKSVVQTAIELDKRFTLKERVSSAMSLTAEERSTPAGEAVLADAIHRVDKVHVADQFNVQGSRWLALPLLPACLAFVVATFVDPYTGKQETANATPQVTVKKQVQDSAAALRKRLEERRKLAEKQNLTEAQQLFEQLEKGTKDLADKGANNRKDALIQLNDLAKQLQERRDQLGGSDALKNMFDKQFKELGSGPADKMARAMQSGDFKKALEELKRVKEEVASGNMSDEDKKKLTQQLQQMEQRMQEMVASQKQAQEQLKEQLAQAQKSGDQQKAQKLQQQLAQMQQQADQMKQMQSLAEKCGKCAQAMQNGDMQQAQSEMNEIANDLEAMEMDAEEMAMLEEAMDQMEEAREQMAGMGMGRGRGQGQNPGQGLGEGRGQGARPEEEDQTGLFDSKVKQKIGQGGAVITEFVEGPNIKGQVQQQLRTEFEAAKSDRSDPLTGQRLPRDYRDHTQDYFDSFRDGDSGSSPAPAEQPAEGDTEE